METKDRVSFPPFETLFQPVFCFLEGGNQKRHFVSYLVLVTRLHPIHGKRETKRDFSVLGLIPLLFEAIFV